MCRRNNGLEKSQTLCNRKKRGNRRRVGKDSQVAKGERIRLLKRGEGKRKNKWRGRTENWGSARETKTCRGKLLQGVAGEGWGSGRAGPAIDATPITREKKGRNKVTQGGHGAPQSLNREYARNDTAPKNKGARIKSREA